MSDRDMRAFRAAQEQIGQARNAARATPPDAARDGLLAQIRRTLDSPDRSAVRRAKDDRADALPAFKKGMEYSQQWISDAVRRYTGALSAEAAANRVEASELRELLGALLRLHEQEIRTPMTQDTQEVQA